MTSPPVKDAAMAAGMPVLQPPRLRDAGWPERLTAYGADLAVVVAFGQILSKAVLDAPTRGSINIHASLLPKYRGAAPIQWAIIRGETETGITTFQMDPGMDTGDVLLMRATAIGPEETAGELSERLARLGAETIVETLARLDSLTPVPQDHAALEEERRHDRLGEACGGDREPRAWLQSVARRDGVDAERRVDDLARSIARRQNTRHAGHAPRRRRRPGDRHRRRRPSPGRGAAREPPRDGVG
jgi:hypothetical protein